MVPDLIALYARFAEVALTDKCGAVSAPCERVRRVRRRVVGHRHRNGELPSRVLVCTAALPLTRSIRATCFIAPRVRLLLLCSQIASALGPPASSHVAHPQQERF
jgi:hypothetical protein